MNDKEPEELRRALAELRKREVQYLDQIAWQRETLEAYRTRIEALQWSAGADPEREAERPTTEWRRLWARSAGDETQRLIIRGRIDEMVEIEERRIAKAAEALQVAQARHQKVTELGRARIAALRDSRHALFFEETATVYTTISAGMLKVHEASTHYELARMPVENAPAELVAIAIRRDGPGLRPGGERRDRYAEELPCVDEEPISLPELCTLQEAEAAVLDALERVPEGIAETELAPRIAAIQGRAESFADASLLKAAARGLACSAKVAVKEHGGTTTYYGLSQVRADIVELSPSKDSPIAQSDEERILQALRRLGPTTKLQLQREVGMGPHAVERLLGKLRQGYQVFLTGRGAQARYYLTAREMAREQALAPAG